MNCKFIGNMLLAKENTLLGVPCPCAFLAHIILLLVVKELLIIVLSLAHFRSRTDIKIVSCCSCKVVNKLFRLSVCICSSVWYESRNGCIGDSLQSKSNDYATSQQHTATLAKISSWYVFENVLCFSPTIMSWSCVSSCFYQLFVPLSWYCNLV